MDLLNQNLDHIHAVVQSIRAFLFLILVHFSIFLISMNSDLCLTFICVSSSNLKFFIQVSDLNLTGIMTKNKTQKSDKTEVEHYRERFEHLQTCQ